MASTELSQSLLDIISSLTQDDIPFKLRCAICNNLAINAFRLPCCDQAICESCQTSLPESCPVCEHNPVSPELCKPNKALRTTLKAFLRTEEKKREKDRPSTTPTVNTTPPAPNVSVETQAEPVIAVTKTSDNAVSAETVPVEPAADVAAEDPSVDQNDVPEAPSVQENGNLVPSTDENGACPVSADGALDDAEAPEGAEAQPAQSESDPNQMYPNMGAGMAGMMPGMGWAGQDMSAMAQFMPNAMGSFPNTMGMPGMGPLNAAQGMFGGFGMNMNNMSNGMNMGYGTEQQMYNNWDNSQSNMYNPNPFSNGMGQDYGTSGYAGYMSQPNGNYSQMQQYPNQNFQNGYYGNSPGYMRGTGRGRGRGFYRGRGGYDHANYYQQNYQNNVSQGPMNQETGQTEDDIKKFNNELAPGGGDDHLADGPSKDSTITGPEDANAADSTDRTDNPLESGNNGEPTSLDEGPTSQLQGIPTIDDIDSAPSQPMGYSRGPMPVMDQGYGRGRGFGRGGFMSHRGGFYNNNNMQGPPPGQGVVGAPLAPRAMREGINRGGLFSGRRTASISQTAENSSRGATPSIPQENVVPHSPSAADPKTRSYSPSRERSPRPSRAQSPPNPESRHSRNHRRDRSGSAHDSIDDRDRKDRHRRSRRDDRDYDARSQSRSRSPSERRSSHRSGKDRDHKSSHRSSRARRHSRSVSRRRERGSAAMTSNGDDKYDLARRIINAQRLGKASSSRHETESRKRGRSEREKRHDHDSDRGTDRDRDGRRDRDKARDRDRERDREKDRKRSRRDRSPSGDESDSSRRHSRRSKRSHRDGHDVTDKERTEERGAASSKDPHTLEREARNRERLMKEKQRRDAMTAERDSKSSRRQHDRETASGRRLNYRYEGDDDDMSRVEEEREAGRWR
ncbi:hypothetical protein TMatcc_004336 [Talaromyces marneffei ATCC 18224]|uniref:RING-type domain-containing protein n=1 Tax=Talaromyces marneffei (strain ATCC 18224 / CBS 334.59 / QM 7333) TaxID=441960 RepID=B6Q5A2_TALMQ|nr:conserved hypothetical protein [Talaromyces marneffei ATCC 18224]KAE8556920.1 hypothetical protein EYB25_001626 [Talaromyces marneffei]